MRHYSDIDLCNHFNYGALPCANPNISQKLWVALHGYGVAEPADGSVSQEFKDMNEIRFTGGISPDKHIDPAKLNVEFTKALKILDRKFLNSHVSMRVMTL